MAAVLTFGTSIFKISRLFTIALIVVHLFSCDYYRVKKVTAVPVDFDSYFTSRDLGPEVAPSRLAAPLARGRDASSGRPTYDSCLTVANAMCAMRQYATRKKRPKVNTQTREDALASCSYRRIDVDKPGRHLR